MKGSTGFTSRSEPVEEPFGFFSKFVPDYIRDSYYTLEDFCGNLLKLLLPCRKESPQRRFPD